MSAWAAQRRRHDPTSAHTVQAKAAHTAAQVREAEAPVLAATPSDALMRLASRGLATAVAEFVGHTYGADLLLLVGAGNNGGDALYAGADLAKRGARVSAVLLDPQRAHSRALAAFSQAGGRRVCGQGLNRLVAVPHLVVDGIVGIGGTGPLRPEAVAWVESLAGIPTVAVDVPSGVDSDTGAITGKHVRADLTVTFGTHKVAHLVDPGALACGVVELVDMGLDFGPPTAEALGPDGVAALLPVPRASAHKYTRGVVGVRAGSPRYPGAGLLSVAGAATGLCGMVRAVAEEALASMILAAHPEVVIGSGKVQAWMVGSGTDSSAHRHLQAALADGVPVVVDADALMHLPEDAASQAPLILTPHAGELARLLGLERSQVESHHIQTAQDAAREFDAVVVAKGRRTIVAAPDGRIRVTTVGPPWLATAGAGDVLAGLIAALVAAGSSPFDAACVGSWLHGVAATRAGEGGPIVAGQVARAVPSVVAQLMAPV